MDVDWGYVELRSSGDRWSPRHRIELPHMDSLNKKQFLETINAAEDADHLRTLLARENSSYTRKADPLDDVVNQLAIAPNETNN